MNNIKFYPECDAADIVMDAVRQEIKRQIDDLAYATCREAACVTLNPNDLLEPYDGYVVCVEGNLTVKYHRIVDGCNCVEDYQTIGDVEIKSAVISVNGGEYTVAQEDIDYCNRTLNGEEL